MKLYELLSQLARFASDEKLSKKITATSPAPCIECRVTLGENGEVAAFSFDGVKIRFQVE